MKVSELANDIHLLNLEMKYFWSAGLIKETLDLWEKKEYFDMLDQVGQVMALAYLEEIAQK